VKEPTLSIDLRSKRIAIFDGLTLVRDFQPYADEMQARMEAQGWISARTTSETQPTKVVYPKITRMRMS